MISIAGKIGCTSETLRRRCREEASGRAVPVAQSLGDKDRLKVLEREVKELRRADEILRNASAYFAQAELDRDGNRICRFIDSHREELGIKLICREVAVAPSSYHEHAAQACRPWQRSVRARRDDEIK